MKSYERLHCTVVTGLRCLLSYNKACADQLRYLENLHTNNMQIKYALCNQPNMDNIVMCK